MRLIHKYIFSQIATYALMAIFVFVFLLLTGSAIRDVLDLLTSGQISFSLFAKILAILTPYLLAYALPFGLLMATLLVLGRMSSQREITAIKAAGISLWHLATPIITLAILGTLLSVFINMYYKPLARRSYRHMLENVVREDPLSFIQEGTFITEFPGYVLYAGKKSGSELQDFWIWELDKAKRATVLLRAQKGTFQSNDDGLTLTLFNGTAEARNSQDPENLQDNQMPMVQFKSSSIQLPWEHLIKKANPNPKLSRLTLNELLAKLQTTPKSEKINRIKIQTQIQQNFVNAFGVLALTLIGIPLGIKSSRKETFANLGIALIIVLIYYGSVTFINSLAKYPAIRPDLLIWLPNLIFCSLGIFLLSKTNKH